MMLSRGRVIRRAFTLTELLVVLMIIGVLMGLLLPAVQYARETARRAQCKNNLRQLGVAVQNFHSAHNQFPPGDDQLNRRSHSWVTFILPHLEQESLYAQYNFSRPWNDESGNLNVALTILPFMRCPTSFLFHPGDTDYGGVYGSSLSGLQFGYEHHQAWGSGTLLRTTPTQPYVAHLGTVTDGASNTILIAEACDMPEPAGMWASGTNCLAHENTGINRQLEGGIHSLHSGVSYVTMADGSVQTLTEEMDLYLLGALCTRNGREIVQW